MHDDIFRGCGIEITLARPEDFLKIKETLTRIGVASPKTRTLYQSCHILHKRSRYSILHFKELFLLDYKQAQTVISDVDYARRNTIVKLLAEWRLCTIVDPIDELSDPLLPVNQIKIVSFKDKQNWTLVSKYEVGKIRR